MVDKTQVARATYYTELVKQRTILANKKVRYRSVVLQNEIKSVLRGLFRMASPFSRVTLYS